MSHVSAYYHVVFCTKERRMTIPLQYRKDVYRFIWKELEAKKCTLLRIGGISNHVHMLINLNPTVALSSLIKDVKSRASGWMQKDDRFPEFEGWGREYYAATVSPQHKESVINYINNQLQHHLGSSIDDELWQIHQQAGLVYDDRHLR